MAKARYNNPINLILRFGLEVFGFWSFLSFPLYAFESPYNAIFAIVFPLSAAIIWRVFRVENDGGEPKVLVKGKLRLLIELLFFGLAIGFFVLRGEMTISLCFSLIVITHYVYSWQRVKIIWRDGALEAPMISKK